MRKIALRFSPRRLRRPKCSSPSPACRPQRGATRWPRRFAEEINGRVLAFDAAAAEHYAEIAMACKVKSPKAIIDAQAQIASIARMHGAAVATRDVRDFAPCGLEFINPWNQ